MPNHSCAGSLLISLILTQKMPVPDDEYQPLSIFTHKDSPHTGVTNFECALINYIELSFVRLKQRAIKKKFANGGGHFVLSSKISFLLMVRHGTNENKCEV